jgi:hypothetical protein
LKADGNARRMKKLIGWSEPVDYTLRKSASPALDRVLPYCVSIVAALGFVAVSSHTAALRAWQLPGVALVVVGGGLLLSRVLPYLYRADIAVLGDGVRKALGRTTSFHYAWASMAHCELVRSGDGPYWLLRMTMKRDHRGEPAHLVREVAVAHRIDPQRLRDILRAAGAPLVAG